MTTLHPALRSLAWRRLSTVAALLLTACAAPDREAAGAAAAEVREARIERVTLVDQVAWETERARGALRRVEVRSNGISDTLPDVLVAEQPVIVGDSVLLGFDQREDAIRRGFRYRAAERETEFFRLPNDLDPVLSRPVIAPSGRHIAYVAREGERRWSPAVATWPRGEPWLAGDLVDSPGTEVLRHRSRWTDTGTFEILVDGGRFVLRFAGDVVHGFQQRDTLPSLPDWTHPPAP